MFENQAPKVEHLDQDGPHERERYTHPAFGEITVRTVSYTHLTLPTTPYV